MPLFRFFRKLRKILFFQKKPKVLLLLYMIQDLDLALIISDFFIANKISHSFILTPDLAKKSPRVVAALKLRRASFWVIPGIASKWSSFLLSYFDALFTIVETSSGPHRVGYSLTQRARELGLKTYTLQHGLENIGLTYFDEKYNKDNVRFASETIFIWCSEARLHPDVPDETRRKCVKVGSPKTLGLSANAQPVVDKTSGKKLVSIFENLHWERYDEAYKVHFVENIKAVAKIFPDILFVIKPHHAGQWLTRKYAGSLDFGANVIVASPTSPDWEPHTGPDIIAASMAVVTTPSTIALDAAILQKPVAVIGDSIDLRFYHPLPILTDSNSWQNFIASALATTALNEDTKRLNNSFVCAVTTPGDTSRLMVEKILTDFNRS